MIRNKRRWLCIALSMLFGAYICGFFLMNPQEMGAAVRQILKAVDASQAIKLIEKNGGNADFVILDVRTEEEYIEGHIENALNMDFYSETFKQDLDKLDKNKTYLIYCRSGSRSARALQLMGELGFREVYNMSGGYIAWEQKGFPGVTEQ